MDTIRKKLNIVRLKRSQLQTLRPKLSHTEERIQVSGGSKLGVGMHHDFDLSIQMPLTSVNSRTPSKHRHSIVLYSENLNVVQFLKRFICSLP
jgi:hypothetical protein